MTNSATALTVGTFDGVHLGHAQILRRLLESSVKLGLSPKVLYFPVPPKFYISGKLEGNLITVSQERKELISYMGIKDTAELNFEEKLQNMEAEEFFEKFIRERHRARALVVGGDFALGRGRKGDSAFLGKMCRKAGIHFSVVDPVKIEGQKVSSTLIRSLIKNGDMEKAAACLGRPYFLSGRVIKGAGIGRKIGFPTANLQIDYHKIIPQGIFAAKTLHEGRMFDSVVSVGRRPTFGTLEMRLLVEVHILNFSKDIYGDELKVFFISRLREEIKFNCAEALIEQIKKDVSFARKRLLKLSFLFDKQGKNS
ncbi:MAG: bifunctional riboflavin kinase/FAD synthetase [Elusimicrobiota bacterium]